MRWSITLTKPLTPGMVQLNTQPCSQIAEVTSKERGQMESSELTHALNRCLDTQLLVMDATGGKTSSPQPVLFGLKWRRWKGRILRHYSKRKGVVSGDSYRVGGALVSYLWYVIDDLSIGWDLKWNESVVSVPDMVCKEKKKTRSLKFSTSLSVLQEATRLMLSVETDSYLALWDWPLQPPDCGQDLGPNGKPEWGLA